MKRVRVTTRSETALARARPCPVSPDALLALLDDADVTVGQLCASTSALASLTADLVARKDESLQLAGQVASFRSALLAHKTRVLGSARRRFRKQCKRIVVDFEAVDVSKEQLRVWARVAGAGTTGNDLHCVYAASPLLASPRLLLSPATRMSSIITDSMLGLPFAGELGSVTTGDGLRAVSAAGLGLKWFEPHSRNEFSVVLAQADGVVPVWLTTGDVLVTVMSTAAAFSAAGVSAGAAAGVRSESVRLGTVSVVYGGLSEDAPSALLQLLVCGVVASDSTGDCDWCVRVPRKPLAGHECAALGTHVRTLAVVSGPKYGMAVSADEKWLVVGLENEGMLSVYSLPGGELARTFSGSDDGSLQFKGLRRLCFAPNSHLILAYNNKRLQELTLEGVFVRFIGVGEFGDRYPYCVAVHDDVIAVGCERGTGPRVLLFDFGTGSVTSRFGVVGTAPGQLNQWCTGIRFTPDGSCVIVAKSAPMHLSVFTTAGVFVRCVGVGVLGGGLMDALQSVTGEYVVADYYNHRVCVFSPDDSGLVRSWGVRGPGDGLFEYPTALAAAGHHLYVMDDNFDSVQVFE